MGANGFFNREEGWEEFFFGTKWKEGGNFFLTSRKVEETLFSWPKKKEEGRMGGNDF